MTHKNIDILPATVEILEDKLLLLCYMAPGILAAKGMLMLVVWFHFFQSQTYAMKEFMLWLLQSVLASSSRPGIQIHGDDSY